jgi:hypothetical protein
MKYLFATAVMAFGVAASADVYVICHSGVDLSEADVKEVFLGEKQSAGSIKIVLSDNKARQDEFLQKGLSMSKTKYEAQWAKRSFREGIPEPTRHDGDADVLSFVKSNEGGVGYVGTPPGTGVKVIKKY